MKINNNVLAVLAELETEGNLARITAQLERPLYVQVNKVLEAAGGKWKSGKVKAHVFPGDAAAALEQVILTGEITVPQDFGYFPTPPAVIVELLRLADLKPGLLCLEPSAGQGNIARELVAAGCTVDLVELLPANQKVLHELGLGDRLTPGDFLNVQPVTRSYDRVVMNPPFERRQDIHHVMHALKFLKPGGLLVSVMSAGITFRADRLTTDFRELIDEHGILEELPDEAFRESGTSVRTVMVRLEA